MAVPTACAAQIPRRPVVATLRLKGIYLDLSLRTHTLFALL